MERRERPFIIHQLPEYAAHGYLPAYEYPLPVSLDPSELGALHLWLQELALLAPSEARAMLDSRWHHLQHDSLLQVRDYLLSCEAISLVLTGTSGWILCVDDHNGTNLVAPPLNSNRINQQLSNWGLLKHPLLMDLLVSFGGLREDFTPAGGCLIDDQRWEGVTESWMEVVEGFSEWRGALIVFSSRGGDKLLLHRSGRVGWWVADEVRMRQAYRDLDVCLLDFLRYRSIPWPFCPYEPRFVFPRIIG